MPNFRFLESSKLSKVRNAVSSYVAARSKLKELGVVQANREVQGEFAEWFATNLLKLERSRPFQKGWDAKDRMGETYEIKSQTVPDLSAPTVFAFRRKPTTSRWIVGVFLSGDLAPLAVVRMSSSDVEERAIRGSRGSRFRWAEVFFRELWVETVWRWDSGLADGARRAHTSRLQLHKGAR
jgi:hypothetical protein